MDQPTDPVLLANEPRSYREAMLVALRALRPHLTVLAVDPEELEAALARCRPRLLVCSALSAAVRARVGAWLLLYPDGTSLAASCLDGRETVAGSADLAGLLALVDRTERPGSDLPCPAV